MVMLFRADRMSTRMLLPPKVAEVSLDHDWLYKAPYPPLGFRPFSDCELGNGDTFGLYWPVGRENQEPIVAETWHDSWQIQPTFSSLSSFLAARARGGDEFPETPSLKEDAGSPRALLDAAREAIQVQSVERAVELLEDAIAVLPEYTEALSLLWAQYMRQGRAEEATAIALRAVVAPPAFGSRSVKALKWLQGQSQATSFAHDPIWQSRHALKLTYGGAKENGDYAVYRSAIDVYIGNSQYVQASILMQTYAQLMHAETLSFQERNGFERDGFVRWQEQVSHQLPHGPRA